VEPRSTGAADDPLAARDSYLRRQALHPAHHGLDLLAEKLPHREDHLLLLFHEPDDGRIAAIEALSARRHRVADIDAPRRIVADPNFTKIVRLLEVQRILIAGRTARPECDDLVVEGLLDISRCRAWYVAADEIELPGDDRMHRIVVVDRDRLARQRLELDDGNRLVRRPVPIRSFPPAPRLGIDDVAIDIDVRLPDAEADSCRLTPLVSKAHRLNDPLRVGVAGCARDAMGMRGREEDMVRRYAELALERRCDGSPHLIRNGARVYADQRRDRIAVVDHDRSRMNPIEDAEVALRQLVDVRRDVDLRRTRRDSPGLRQRSDRSRGDQDRERSDYRAIRLESPIVESWY